MMVYVLNIYFRPHFTYLRRLLRQARTPSLSLYPVTMYGFDLWSTQKMCDIERDIMLRSVT